MCTCKHLTADWKVDLLQAQETASERGSVILSETALSMSESSLTLERPTASAMNVQGDFNQPITGECFVLTSFRPEMNAVTPGPGLPAPEGSEHNQDIHMSVIKRHTPEGENRIAMETNQAFQRVSNSEDYLQPVDNDNLQAAAKNTDSCRLCHRKAETLPPNCPQARPRVKILDKRETERLFQCKDSTFTGPLLSLQFTDMLQENPLYRRETAEAQHCASVKSADKSNRLIPQTRTRHGQHTYQNDTCTTTADQDAANPSQSPLRPACNRDTPYARVNCNTNWEVSRDHLSLFERIGGGHLVRCGRVRVLTWLVLKAELKPHPNVIQLLGCLTKDVVRCKGMPDFRPPLVILEFVPHGDLLGYLRKSKGATDDYYNLRSADVPRKIPIQQLYKFASDIARGMEFISAHQGVVPVKWLAIESLTNHVYTTQSDVWSYGIVLYEIFTLGGKLYEGMTGEEVFNFVASGDRLPRTPSMSSEVYKVMLQCWQGNPSKRPTFGSIASWMENCCL
ncbi:hypothetical protein OS493_020502 [Desmophyllum pertusum]|uniref:Protein kinase domain-containing protein n=1 Tax=Desmophyllum pertusum TaxID=174260 RepID=A0A9W9YYR5_9CNID|nr:hypothetical protein OS493_020502 [Desmophyllum pertusum]